jgi:hypothetical protein
VASADRAGSGDSPPFRGNDFYDHSLI